MEYATLFFNIEKLITNKWMTMSQKLPINSFEWIKDASQFSEDFIKNYNEESDEGYFLEIHVQYIKKLHEIHNDLPWFNRNKVIENVKELIYMKKLKTLYT